MEFGPPLDAMEQRILGSLLEKQRTVPASYPLSLNGLRTACNQTSSRDPVVDYGENEIHQCLQGLRERELVRPVWAGKGSRAMKFHQRLEERLSLTDPEVALIAVLLLRGAQAPGELRTRTERMHPFADRHQVEAQLAAMAERGLVQELPRRAGQQDNRWVHLLGPVAWTSPEPVESVDLDVVLAAGAQARDEKVRSTYDVVASSYAEHLLDELDHKPFDTWLLRRLAAETEGLPMVEVGCGPGQVTKLLADAGAEVMGLDLAPAMVAQARERFPDLSFEVGDLRALLRPTNASAWGAIVAWYSFVHLAGSELPDTLSGLARTLAPGGVVAVALHVGSEVQHRDEWWGHDVDIDFVLHDADVVRAAFGAAGLTVREWYLRSPLTGVEVETERLYVVACTAVG